MPVGSGDRIEPGAMIGVDEVEPDRQVLQPHLALARRRQVDLHPFHLLRPAGLLDADGVGLRS